MNAPILLFTIIGILFGSQTAPVSKLATVTLVTPSDSRSIQVVRCQHQETWATCGAQLTEPGVSGAVITYPYERVVPFNNQGATVSVTAAVLNSEGQVLAVFNNVDANTLHAFPEPMSALLLLPPIGAVGLAAGHLVNPSGFSFKPTTTAPIGQQGRKAAIDKLQHQPHPTGASLLDLGRLLLRDEQFTLALAIFKKAQRGDTKSEATVGSAGALIGLGRTREALTMLSTLIDQTPDFVPAYRALCRVLKVVNEPALIVPLFKSGLAKAPGSNPLKLAAARFYLQIGQLHRAKQLLVALNGTHEENIRAQRLLGAVELRAGHQQKAATHFAAYLKGFQNAPGAKDLRKFIARHLPDGKKP